MKKSTTYSITKCETRNELVDALESNKAVIEIMDSLKDELTKELIKQNDKGKINRKAGKGLKRLGILGIALAFVPGANVLELLLYGGGALTVGAINSLIGKTDFLEYRLAIFEEKSGMRFMFVSKCFDTELDTIQGFSKVKFVPATQKICPSCGASLNFKGAIDEQANPVKCPDCNQIIIWMMETDDKRVKKSLASDEMENSEEES